jgi:hypothetical protein
VTANCSQECLKLSSVHFYVPYFKYNLQSVSLNLLSSVYCSHEFARSIVTPISIIYFSSFLPSVLEKCALILDYFTSRISILGPEVNKILCCLRGFCLCLF